MLIRMPDQSPSGPSLELPASPRRLIWTAAWNMAESVGLPFGAWIVVTDVAGRNPGLLAGLARGLAAHRDPQAGDRARVSALLMISAIVLTLQTAVVIFTGNVWMYLLQFPLANLAMCVFFARTAPTRKPLVAQLAAEVVALKQPEAAPPGAAPLLPGRDLVLGRPVPAAHAGHGVHDGDRAVQALHAGVDRGHHRPDAGRRRRLRHLVPRGRPPPRPAPPLPAAGSLASCRQPSRRSRAVLRFSLGSRARGAGRRSGPDRPAARAADERPGASRRPECGCGRFSRLVA